MAEKKNGFFCQARCFTEKQMCVFRKMFQCEYIIASGIYNGNNDNRLEWGEHFLLRYMMVLFFYIYKNFPCGWFSTCFNIALIRSDEMNNTLFGIIRKMWIKMNIDIQNKRKGIDKQIPQSFHCSPGQLYCCCCCYFFFLSLFSLRLQEL